MSDSGWICPICRAWNPSTAVVCCNTPQHDGEDD